MEFKHLSLFFFFSKFYNNDLHDAGAAALVKFSMSSASHAMHAVVTHEVVGAGRQVAAASPVLSLTTAPLVTSEAVQGIHSDLSLMNGYWIPSFVCPLASEAW